VIGTPSSYLEVTPVSALSGYAVVPSSKPETQRAILAATLATGLSVIHNDLRCFETTLMKQACEALGAKILERERFLEIQGVGGVLQPHNPIINAEGSGLVFRVLTALTCFTSGLTVITGDATLRTRVMSPLFDGLRQLGAKLECIGDKGRAPVANLGGGLKGGDCVLPGNVSSQFITAIMFAAPLAAEPTKIRIEGEVLSRSYIQQTIQTLRHAGIKVDASVDLSEILVHPGTYKAAEYRISGDFTSASYLIGASALFKGTVVLENLTSHSLQGERAIVDVVEALGVTAEFDDANNRTILTNPHPQISGNFTFDASDCPNIVPTLAAIGAHVAGTFRVTGGSITRLHKSPRIKAMVTELSKLGVPISPLYKGEVLDGFEILGQGGQYAGGQTLESWGDHRIFMSLFVASLRCRQTNRLKGHQDVVCSFADFREQFESLGVESVVVSASEVLVVGKS